MSNTPNTDPLNLGAIQVSFAAQQQLFCQQTNDARKKDFEDACYDWAANYRKTGGKVGPPPVAPKMVAATVGFENGFHASITPTDQLVSGLDPWSLVKTKEGTDPSYPIGAAIPNAPGCYLSTHVGSPHEGEEVTLGSRKFRYQKYFFGLGGFWREVTNG